MPAAAGIKPLAPSEVGATKGYLMTRAKFTVVSKTQTLDGFRVHMLPVTSGSEENKAFYEWTPSGSIDLGTINPVAAEQLELGKEYYVDFTPATTAT